MEKHTDEINISYMMKDLIIKDIMAFVLDLSRISSLGDRQFKQYEKTVKDKMYDIIRSTNDMLVEYTDFKTSPTDEILPKFISKND